MTMLTTIQKFTRRSNLSVPSTVYGSTDSQVLQILNILEEVGEDLVDRGDWESLTNEATHTTIAAESQGAITSIATNGFSYIKNDTIWDRNLQLPVYVISDKDWQQTKAVNVTGPRYQARIRGGLLIANPTPAAGHTWAFEYISNNWILDTDGTTYKGAFTADTDTMLFPEKIILMGIKAFWKKEKGFEYAEDFEKYEMMIENALSRDGMKRTIYTGDRRKSMQPSIYVPEGTWGL